ncbi:hypothetical protein HRH25_00130 [Flavisolibacter sp. BT320]|nr:hypothetical protein [Flavisolibacter longurius]
MKSLVLLLFFGLAACQPGNQTGLTGTWVSDTTDASNRDRALFEKLLFLENDSFRAEIFMDGRLQESFRGHYVFNERQKRLTTTVGTVVAKSEIVHLTNEKLTIKFESTKSLSHYRRQ